MKLWSQDLLPGTSEAQWFVQRSKEVVGKGNNEFRESLFLNVANNV